MAGEEQTDQAMASLQEALANERAMHQALVWAKDETISTQTTLISELQTQLEECRQADGIEVPPGSDLQAAMSAAPEGATLRLSGTYTGKNFRPKSGQRLVGPATIKPSGTVTENNDGFRCKASGEAFDVTFVDLDVFGYGRHGIGCWVGTTVLGGRLHHNGKDGIGGDLEGRPSRIKVSGTEMDYNGNTVWLGKGAAGAKFFHTHGVEVVNCHVHHNFGNGVWCDAQCGDWLVTGNHIEQNHRKGVFYEKCGASDGTFDSPSAVYEGFATITDNIILNNNREGQDNAHPGVALYSSKNVRVENNTFGGNGNAVIVRDDPARLNDDKHGWVPENIAIYNNILGGDRLIGCDLPGVACGANA